MKFFSAFMKSIARDVNDSIADHNREKAKDTAFKNAGKQISSAKKSGTYVNGSQIYKKELQKQNALIDRKHKRREKFIDDL